MINAHADKNLGLVGVDAEQYIQWGLQEHLLDPTTYQLILEEDAKIAANELYTTIYQWKQRHSLSDHLTQDRKNYIRQKNPQGKLRPLWVLLSYYQDPQDPNVYKICLFQSCKSSPFSRAMGRPFENFLLNLVYIILYLGYTTHVLIQFI